MKETEFKENIMSKIVKTSLVALSLIASASMGYAANNKNDGAGYGRDTGSDGRSDMEQREMLDPNSTGSIQTCGSQSYDEFGNCVVTPDMQ